MVILALDARETLIKWQVWVINHWHFLFQAIYAPFDSVISMIKMIIIHPLRVKPNCVYKHRQSRSYCSDLSPGGDGGGDRDGCDDDDDDQH